MEYDPPSPPEMGLRGLRALRESGVLPKESATVAEFQETLISLLLDAGCLRGAMQNSRGEWEQRLFARHLALVLHEGFEDMAALLPAATRQFAQLETAAAIDARARLRELNSTLSALHRKYASDLQPVRHAAAAHRDHNIRRFHEAVDNLNLERLDEAVTDLIAWSAAATTTVMALLCRHLGVQPTLAQSLEEDARRVLDQTWANPAAPANQKAMLSGR